MASSLTYKTMFEVLANLEFLSDLLGSLKDLGKVSNRLYKAVKKSEDDEEDDEDDEVEHLGDISSYISEVDGIVECCKEFVEQEIPQLKQIVAILEAEAKSNVNMALLLGDLGRLKHCLDSCLCCRPSFFYAWRALEPFRKSGKLETQPELLRKAAEAGEYVEDYAEEGLEIIASIRQGFIAETAAAAKKQQPAAAGAGAGAGAATTALQEPINELASVKAQIVTLHAQMQRDLAVLNMEGVLAANETLKGLLEKKEALSRLLE
jgi:hypothetical protein